MNLARQYYQILGVTPENSTKEIKSAFRKMAKKYHPDINHQPGSKEKFIHITEAYEFIIRQVNIPQQEGVNNERVRDVYYHDFMKDWMQQERERIRREAAREAKMNYQKYMNSRAFKTTNALSAIVDYFALMFGLLVISAAIYGVSVLRESDELNFNRILMAICLFIIGLIIFVFTFSHLFLDKEKNKG